MNTTTSAFFKSLLTASLVLCAACSVVTTRHPLPADQDPVDREKFEGAWIADDKVIQVQFLPDGSARLGALAWEDRDFQPERGSMLLTKGAEANYMSVRFEQKDEEMEGYVFAQYKFTDGGDLVIWPPKVDAFRAAVEDGRLQGTVVTDQYSKTVSLTNAPGELLAFIEAATNLALFEYREPLVLRKAWGKTKTP